MGEGPSRSTVRTRNGLPKGSRPRHQKSRVLQGIFGIRLRLGGDNGIRLRIEQRIDAGSWGLEIYRLETL